jgi:hypothetical protein
MQVHFSHFQDDCLRDEAGSVHALIVFGSSFPVAPLPDGQATPAREMVRSGLELRQSCFLRKRELDLANSLGPPGRRSARL